MSTGKIAAVGLPLNHQKVFEMEPGQVSDVIADPNGYYIYKVVSKQMVPLAQASKEIRKSIASERVQDATASLGKSIKSRVGSDVLRCTTRERPPFRSRDIEARRRTLGEVGDRTFAAQSREWWIKTYECRVACFSSKIRIDGRS